MQTHTPFPKNKINVLLLENIHAAAHALYEYENYNVQTIKSALSEDELIQAIEHIHILGIRSKTSITEHVLNHAKKLMAIGTYCIGTNQIALTKAAQKGVAVFNAPYSNTRSVVELAIGEIIALARNIIPKNMQMHDGVWDKSAGSSFEIRGKILGIVGYGNIGSQLSVLAEAMGMHVYFYDIADRLVLGNARKCNSLQELLQVADIVSVHVDGRKSNENLIAKREFDLMKEQAIFLNLSRGHIVDIEALSDALKSGKIRGASVDVYPVEPASNGDVFSSVLQHLPNTILTPHIGGSTAEAQENIGDYVTRKVINYINNGDSYGAVNFPEVQLPTFTNTHRMLHIHENVPGILAQINAVFAKNNVNIQSQFLKTNDEIGYVITDVNEGYASTIANDIKDIPHTIKFRILY